MIVDTHAHYDHSKFKIDRESVLNSLQDSDIGLVLNVGISVASSEASMRLAERKDFIFFASGTHPHEASGMTEAGLNKLKALCAHPKCMAVGEIGLDFYHNFSPKDIQRDWFKRQLELALEVGLPVVIHARECDSECFETIKKSGVRKGVIHCYSGSAELAKEYVKLGFHIGVGGVLTYSNSRRLVETCTVLPLDRLVLETDCPYLSPEPFRKDRNDSRLIPFVVEKLARIRKISPEEVREETTKNAKALFKFEIKTN
ncbi:MAG: TatD family hydrolase [Clostridiales bacterium]|jgi:TatD DNase family protein|nr:TatD family hydrolase [Clostridiales bacterium]MDR2749291.1 TatD family hydrolase [Clostridiales bacterium]